MATLHVRNVPSDVYERLRALADARDSSISAETVRLLRRALRLDAVQARRLLDEVESGRPVVKGRASSAALVREDRDRR